MKHYLYILSYCGKYKLYWNVLLGAWVKSVNSATPFTQEEIDERLKHYGCFPFGIRFEVVTYEGIK